MTMSYIYLIFRAARSFPSVITLVLIDVQLVFTVGR